MARAAVTYDRKFTQKVANIKKATHVRKQLTTYDKVTIKRQNNDGKNREE